MTTKQLIFEDLRAGDLVDMVKNMIEIDTYKPKIDPKNVVVAFFVQEENAAYDLSHFIEFSSDEVEDTEVSPAPNRAGYYVVYIEFGPVNIAKKVYEMLKAVTYLTDIEKWSYLAYKKKGYVIIK